ncbi:helix-turn-helix protein [Nocardiopsis sp. Huas11]|uniref:helix-turn-helix transcriptional regulator n=1 Tax=Nocardiopsis sp. Huas11 TaxID=2183912 RepID=UPI000F12AC69|nr:helix-turn-helix transcriptional regulator [Nocardiopsis sp. Huas11]RKS08118.1 helix-turn-helix protein [Nocardiopsis sp. Huas11]
MHGGHGATPDRSASHGDETSRSASARLVENGHPRGGANVPPEEGWYRETRIADTSSAFICVWTHRAGSAPARVIPDNHADFIVSSAGAAWLVGPATSVDLPEIEPGTVLRGLRIHTASLRAVTGVDGAELRDRALPVADLLPSRKARTLVDVLDPTDVAEAMDAANPTDVMVAAPPDLRALWPDAGADARVREAVRLLSGGGGGGIDAVARTVALTPRHLRRLVERETGLGPKTLQRVGRLQRALHVIREGGPLTLADVASSVGYADQAHFAHDVRRFTGRTPRAYLASRPPESPRSRK